MLSQLFLLFVPGYATLRWITVSTGPTVNKCSSSHLTLSHKLNSQNENKRTDESKVDICSLMDEGFVGLGPVLMYILFLPLCPFVLVSVLSSCFYLMSTQTDSLTPLLTFTHPSCSLLQLGLGSRVQPKCLDVRLLKGLLKLAEILNGVQRAHRCIEKCLHAARTARGNRAGRQVRQGGIVWSCFSSLQVGLLRVCSTDLCSDGSGTLSKNIKRAWCEVSTAWAENQVWRER